MGNGENVGSGNHPERHSIVAVDRPPKRLRKTSAASQLMLADSTTWPALSDVQPWPNSDKSPPPQKDEVDGCGAPLVAPPPANVEQPKKNRLGNFRSLRKIYSVSQNRTTLKQGSNVVPSVPVHLPYYPTAETPVLHDRVPLPPFFASEFNYPCLRGTFTKPNMQVVKSSDDASAQKFVPQANGGLQSSLCSHSSAQDSDATGRSKRANEKCGQMNPSCGNQGPVVSGCNFHLQNSIGLLPLTRLPLPPSSCLINRPSLPGGCSNTIKHYMRLKTNSLVLEDLGHSILEERNLNLDIPLLFIPRGPRSKRKVPRTGRVAISRTAVEGASKEFCGTESFEHERIIRKGCKRKIKRKDESRNSETNISSHFRLRGQTKKAWNGCYTSIIERGKLDSGTFIHYLTNIWNAFSKEKVKSFDFMDPIWFYLYANGKHKVMVLNRIREFASFSKKYIFVPIILWSHWSLLIFCHLGEPLDSKNRTPCMLLLDSLHTIGPKRLEPLIRRLLFDIYEIEGGKETKKELKKVQLLIPKVPQQKKDSECGYIVLFYIYLFMQKAPENFCASDGYPYFMNKDWFTSEALEYFYEWLHSFPASVFSNHDDSAYVDSGDCIETTFVK